MQRKGFQHSVQIGYIICVAFAWLILSAESRSSGSLVGGRGGRSREKNAIPDNSIEEEYADFDEKFIILESTYTQRRESMVSAWTLLLLILGVIGGCTILWYCYAIGVPLWRDRKASRRRSYTLTSVNVKGSNGDDMPLHETPSTATPSP